MATPSVAGSEVADGAVTAGKVEGGLRPAERRGSEERLQDRKDLCWDSLSIGAAGGKDLSP